MRELNRVEVVATCKFQKLTVVAHQTRPKQHAAGAASRPSARSGTRGPRKHVTSLPSFQSCQTRSSWALDFLDFAVDRDRMLQPAQPSPWFLSPQCSTAAHTKCLSLAPAPCPLSICLVTKQTEWNASPAAKSQLFCR